VNCRLKKMEKRKEAKAAKAANVEAAIEEELMTRLKSGTYGDIYNFPMAQYNAILDRKAVPDGEEEVAKGTVAAEEDDLDDADADLAEEGEESDDEVRDSRVQRVLKKEESAPRKSAGQETM
jgi:protein MAK16